jgi:hypothetical protein
MIKKVYKSYEEARLDLNIPDNDIYLKITNHPKSLNKILYNGNVLYYVGEGSKSYPGFPSGNQMYGRQMPLFNKLSKDYYVHAFNQIDKDSVVYLGAYSFIHIRKKPSFEGFTYFEIKMRRKGWM